MSSNGQIQKVESAVVSEQAQATPKSATQKAAKSTKATKKGQLVPETPNGGAQAIIVPLTRVIPKGVPSLRLSQSPEDAAERESVVCSYDEARIRMRVEGEEKEHKTYVFPQLSEHGLIFQAHYAPVVWERTG